MDRIDANGRPHRYLGRKRIPLVRWFPWLWREVDVWRVELPSSKVLCLPAIRETGGGAEATYYSSTDDGHIVSVNADYAACRSAGSGSAQNAGTTLYVGQVYAEPPGEYTIYRAVVFFDTSGLPTRAFVTAGTLGLYGQMTEAFTTFNVTIVSYAGSQPPVNDDFDQFGTTDLGNLSTSPWSLAGYNNITLNASGRAAISKTATTALGLRSSRDISGTSPGGNEYVGAYTADRAGTSEDPKLVLTYAIPRGGVGVGNPMIFG